MNLCLPVGENLPHGVDSHSMTNGITSGPFMEIIDSLLKLIEFR